MEYDDIIVGAGSSGAVLAARLSEDADRSVLLIEAGPDYPTIENSPDDILHSWVSMGPHDWGFVARATPNHEIAYPRGKVTGGSSAINGHIALRGTPQDFDEWDAWVIRSGASRRFFPSIASSRPIVMAVAISTVARAQSGSNALSPTPGSPSTGPFTALAGRWVMPKSGIITILSRLAWDPGPATDATAFAFPPRLVISPPRAIAST